MTGLSMGATAIASQVPLARPPRVLDIGTAQGGVRAARSGAPAPHGRRLRPARSRPVFDEYVAGFGLSDRLRFHPGDFFADPLPRPTCSSWATSSTTGTSTRSCTLLGKAYARAPRRRRAHRLRRDHRRRTPRQRLRAADEPEHAHRDAGRLRLHRRRLPRWMREAGFRDDPRRTPRRARLDGRRHQVATIHGTITARLTRRACESRSASSRPSSGYSRSRSSAKGSRATLRARKPSASSSSHGR